MGEVIDAPKSEKGSAPRREGLTELSKIPTTDDKMMVMGVKNITSCASKNFPPIRTESVIGVYWTVSAEVVVS